MLNIFKNSKSYVIASLSVADASKISLTADVICYDCGRQIHHPTTVYHLVVYNVNYCPCCYEHWESRTGVKSDEMSIYESKCLQRVRLQLP